LTFEKEWERSAVLAEHADVQRSHEHLHELTWTRSRESYVIMVKPISSACMTDAVYARMQKAGSSARTEVYAIEEWERVQAEAALAKEQEEAILVRTCLLCSFVI